MRTFRRLFSALCVALVVLPVLAIMAPAAHAQTGESYFVLYGEPGEYISQGDDVFHAESGDITFSPSVNYDNGISVIIDVRADGVFVEQWHTNFAAPDETPLAAGDSFLATRFPFQAAGNAGMSVSGDGRGCNTLYGEFAIRELIIDANGDVENFAADFRQSCDGGAAIVGGVRINSTLDNPSRDFRVSPAPTGETNFVLYGQPGDYLTQGADVTWTQGPGVVFVPSVNFDNGITIRIDVRDSSTGAFIDRWTTNLAAPGDVPLAAGDEFTNATRFPFQAADAAGLSITGDGRGCSDSVGEFRVYELSTNSVGQIDNFAADFRHACGESSTPVVGGIRLNSTVAATDPDFMIEPPIPVDTTPPVATAELIQTGRIKRMASDFYVSAVCTDENPGAELVSAEINGVSVSPGQKVRLVISSRERVSTRKGKLTIESASITLTVSCIDAAGNTAVATTQPSYDG